MAAARLNLSTEAAVKALERGELPWTLHPGCAFESDPGQWGASLINNVEVMIACLNAAAPRSIVEVGAYAGDVTRFLLEWAQGAGASVWAIDPMPQPELVKLSEDRTDLTLVQATSHHALAELERADVYVIDGDHNYYTVSEEIRLAAGHGPGLPPLLLFHDIGWPHARRDNYYVPEQIPAEHRQPMVEGGGAFPGHSEPLDGGLPFKWMADHEGGPRNGVLTAVEDFVAGAEKLRFAHVPAFFGFGVVWHEDAPYAARIAEIVAPLDRNPILQRLEANRTFHLASTHVQMTQVAEAHERIARLEAFLERLAKSRAFIVADLISRLRVRAGIAPEHHALSRAEIRRVLAEDNPS
jgi:hypothetical protein